MQRFPLHIMAPTLLLFFVFPVGGQDNPSQEQQFETAAEELSYALGMDVGNSIKRYGAELNLEIFIDAVRTTFQGGTPLVTPQRAREVKQEFLRERRLAKIAERKAASEKNLAEGQAFLASNREKDGVITTESGLQYRVVREGDGATPKPTDTVTVHYRGTLLDGTEFDSSHKRGKPATFPVKGVIAGWVEALQMMSVGSTYELFIPPQLAYGTRGSGAQIAPNSTLIFEVELLGIAGSEAE